MLEYQIESKDCYAGWMRSGVGLLSALTAAV